MSKQPKISSDLENEFLLKATLGVTEMVHPSVMEMARKRGRVTDMPGVRGALISKQHYLEALQEFGNEHPEVFAVIEETARRKAEQKRQRDAKREWAKQGRGFAQ